MGAGEGKKGGRKRRDGGGRESKPTLPWPLLPSLLRKGGELHLQSTCKYSLSLDRGSKKTKEEWAPFHSHDHVKSATSSSGSPAQEWGQQVPSGLFLSLISSPWSQREPSLAYLRPHDVAVKLVCAWGTLPICCTRRENLSWTLWLSCPCFPASSLIVAVNHRSSSMTLQVQWAHWAIALGPVSFLVLEYALDRRLH